ncbi:hypothetical protein MMC27_003629 [Xylographa pallens]|nr:hypothetical protein [Xylographa pallens]
MQFPISSSIALLSFSSSIAAYAYPGLYSDDYNLAERDAYPSMYSDQYNLAERNAHPSIYSDEYDLAERDAYPSIYSDEYNLAERDAFAKPEPYEPALRFYERGFDEDSLYERDLALQEQFYRRELADLKIRDELVARGPNGCHTCVKGTCKVGGHITKDAKGRAKAWVSGPCPAKAAPDTVPDTAPAAA